MSLLSRLLDENYDAPGESDAMRRGDSNAYLKRMKGRTPSAKMSQAAGQWSYNPVEMTPLNATFTKWSPPKKMSNFSAPSRTITVRQESIDEITSYLDGVMEAVFDED